MKKIFYLFIALLMISPLSAQNKTLTVYYGNDSTKVVNIANSDSIVIFICGVSKVSYEGKEYNTVLIGDQCWLKENLDVGEMIQGTSNQTNNSIIEKYCFNDLPENCATYGGLYQWNEVMQYVTTEGAQGICPDGWHIPTLAEFQTLSSTAGGDGNALKAIGQGSGGGAGTNTSGFSALLAGIRNTVGNFQYLGYSNYFWSSSEPDINVPSTLHVRSYDSAIGFNVANKPNGLCVRCIKD